ncbi:tegument serine/threonine protein kinase [Mandrillus leucophaeus cytomegalovirus]|uniref:Tegument serine/threonine protein kinase n=1 Tax=Mandrillus leucophaeus cytomegalovirus TaxID=1654930 RepID=A0A0G2UGM1_9BETA|nr:tegument serine/threonine protein kinase [Mandrillus leucophaeus cytomegalovirus]AKI29753.1 tegument serine/threonine protein kinase [Mandrillus leucophaeus cytomegalovirus]
MMATRSKVKSRPRSVSAESGRPWQPAPLRRSRASNRRAWMRQAAAVAAESQAALVSSTSAVTQDTAAQSQKTTVSPPSPPTPLASRGRAGSRKSSADVICNEQQLQCREEALHWSFEYETPELRGGGVQGRAPLRSSATTPHEEYDDYPACSQTSEASVNDDHEAVHCTCSNDQVITTSIRGLVCDASFFARITQPELCEMAVTYLLVYVPKDQHFCQRVCYAVDMSDPQKRIGCGSFGEVWPLDRHNVVKIARKHNETILSAYMSGLIRTRAGPLAEENTGVYHGLMTATGCCLMHNITLYTRFHIDLFHYEDWDLTSVTSYRRAFHHLADGIKFLNHTCKVCHFDISPMNVLINVNPHYPSEILHAVLCDYSLSEPYPVCNDRCVVVFQETGTARRIPNCTHRVRECYHPAFRPLPLQKLMISNPHARFPDNSMLRRFCMAELAALGNVLGFCLVRLLDRRGIREVQGGPEMMLFKHASTACRALEHNRLTACSDACMLIMAAQLAYHACLLGNDGLSIVNRTVNFVESKLSSCRVRAFRRYYHECLGAVPHDYVRKNLERLLAVPDGVYLYTSFRRTANISSEEDLDGDCRQVFAD